MNDKIGIKIDAKKLTPAKFIEAVEAFVSVVQGVARNVARSPINWTVEVAKGSTVFRMVPENPNQESDEAIHAVKGGFRSLSAGIRTVPNGFTQPEMRGLRILAGLLKDDAVKSIALKNGGRWEELPQSVIPIVDSILTKESHDAFGSIEGEIVAFSRRQAFECTIKDPIYRREIPCYLQNEESEKNAIKGFQEKARVLADGLVHYSKEGELVNITASSIRVFLPESELPTLEDVQAIYKLR